MTTPFLAIYGALGRMAALAAPRFLRKRVREGKEDPVRVGERMAVPSRERPEGRLVWLHGASVGESLSLLPVIEGLRARRPDVNILMTSGTVAAAQMMGKRLPQGVIHQYSPVDLPDYAARFTRYWSPELAVFAESDIWPSLLTAARARGVRTALLSARMSEGSLQRWATMSGTAMLLLGGFDLVMAQDKEMAKALKSLGARNDGLLNLKFAGDPLPVNAADRAEMLERLNGRPLLVAASTHGSEDATVVDGFAPLAKRPDRPLLVLAPRHPKRGGELAAMIRQKRLVVARRSLGEVVTAETEVLLADTLGELGLWYSLAHICFVGGSLIEGYGGHNPLEPARLGCPLVTGLYVDAWQDAYRSLAAVDGYRTVGDPASFAYAFAKAIDRPEEMREMAERARELAEQGAAPLDHALERLVALIDRRGSLAPP